MFTSYEHDDIISEVCLPLMNMMISSAFHEVCFPLMNMMISSRGDPVFTLMNMMISSAFHEVCFPLMNMMISSRGVFTSYEHDDIISISRGVFSS